MGFHLATILILNTSMRTAFFTLALAAILSANAQAQVYASPQAAKSDPDFALQGEYVDDTRGMQVIAEGDGEFRIKIYKDGLPGAGWDGSEIQEIEAPRAFQTRIHCVVLGSNLRRSMRHVV